MSRLSELYEAREFTEGRITEARRQMGLIGHHPDNEEYQGRERDIAGFEKTIEEIDAKISALTDGP
jgi:hypothetical protein